MRNIAILVAFLVSFSAILLAQVSVTVSSPAPSATLDSQSVQFKAYATSSHPITGWRLYVDYKNVYSAASTSSISPTLTLAVGSHDVIIRAWDSTGDSGSREFTITTNQSTSSLPTNAKVFPHIEDMTSWQHCRSKGCSGSDAWASYWMAQFQTTPSLDGSSAEFYVGGNAWADVLWAKKVGYDDSASHFLYDYYVRVDGNARYNAEALEFDLIQVYNGRKYNFSNQCNYGVGTWDTWNEVAQHWVHTSIACPKFSANIWHHIVLEVERLSGKTHYLSITVDGVKHVVPSQYAWFYSVGTNWSHSVIAQVQMDLNGHNGSFHEWVDRMTIIAW